MRRPPAIAGLFAVLAAGLALIAVAFWVSAQFLHLPGAVRESVHRRLAAAVRPGGTLLIVGHHPSDLQTTVRRPQVPDLLVTAEQMATSLDAGEWDIVTASAERETTDADDRTVVIRDAVLRAVRRT